MANGIKTGRNASRKAYNAYHRKYQAKRRKTQTAARRKRNAPAAPRELTREEIRAIRIALLQEAYRNHGIR